MATLYCKKCGRTKDEKKFYTSNNLTKYPNGGKIDICKECYTMMVDNWDPDTFLPLLEDLDVPYVPKIWTGLIQKFCKNPESVNGTTILGRYLRSMRLNQWKKYRWADSEFLQKVDEEENKNAMRLAGLSESDIAEEMAKHKPIPDKPPEFENYQKVESTEGDGGEDFISLARDEADAAVDLTEEDKTYLRLKWGYTYRPSEWVQLEQLYQEMMESYDIQTAAHKDTLKLICKASLKANQMADLGDTAAFQQMAKVYDSLMKSGNFTAAQNKAEERGFVDSIGELVALCETDGYIERYYVSKPNDMVDQTLLDMKRYTATLIKEETNLGELIEQAIKRNQKEDEQVDEDLDILNDENMTLEDIERQITYDDHIEFNDFIDSEIDGSDE